MHSSGTQTHLSQAHKGKRKSFEPVTMDGRDKEQGKLRWPQAQVATFLRSSCPSPDPGRPMKPSNPSLHPSRRSLEGKQQVLGPISQPQRLGRVLFLGQNHVNNLSAFPEPRQFPGGDGARGT